MRRIVCKLCNTTWWVVTAHTESDAVRHVMQRHGVSRVEAWDHLQGV